VKFILTKELKMSKPESVMIDDVKYVREDSVKAAVCGTVKIVVLQRGWVVVGNLATDPEDSRQRILTNAAVIRDWGATKGLGEIAFNGPTNKTILDETPTMRFHVLTIITTIDCDGAKWQSAL
jgi:hypothetical protein